MRHSKKKPEEAPLPEQDVMGSEDDFAPGGSSDGDSAVSSPLEGAADVEPRVSAGTSAEETGSDLAVERDRYLRLAAEYDNYRKRSMKERQDAGSRAQADLVRQLVEALDDVARFAHIDPATTDAAT